MTDATTGSTPSDSKTNSVSWIEKEATCYENDRETDEETEDDSEKSYSGTEEDTDDDILQPKCRKYVTYGWSDEEDESPKAWHVSKNTNRRLQSSSDESEPENLPVQTKVERYDSRRFRASRRRPTYSGDSMVSRFGYFRKRHDHHKSDLQHTGVCQRIKLPDQPQAAMVDAQTGQ